MLESYGVDRRSVKHALWCVCLVSGCVAPTSATAAAWGVGSSLALSSVWSDVHGSGSSTILAIPSNSLTYQPGFRVAFADESHAHEVTLDSGVMVIDEAGSTLSLVVAQVSYQHVFAAAHPTAPMANVGLGFYREGGAAQASTSTSFGAGIGVRHRIHDGHGDVRAELRADYLRDDETFSRPALTSVGLRLGFDLWL